MDEGYAYNGRDTDIESQSWNKSYLFLDIYGCSYNKIGFQFTSLAGIVRTLLKLEEGWNYGDASYYFTHSNSSATEILGYPTIFAYVYIFP